MNEPKSLKVLFRWVLAEGFRRRFMLGAGAAGL